MVERRHGRQQWQQQLPPHAGGLGPRMAAAAAGIVGGAGGLLAGGASAPAHPLPHAAQQASMRCMHCVGGRAPLCGSLGSGRRVSLNVASFYDLYGNPSSPLQAHLKSRASTAECFVVAPCCCSLIMRRSGRYCGTRPTPTSAAGCRVRASTSPPPHWTRSLRRRAAQRCCGRRTANRGASRPSVGRSCGSGWRRWRPA